MQERRAVQPAACHIRTGSVPRLLGLRNGELLTRINRTKLTSVKALEKAVAGIRTADSVTLHVLRDGETFKVHIEFE